MIAGGSPELNITNSQNGVNEDKSLIGNIINDLGGVVFAVEAIDKTLEFAGSFFKQNRKFQFCVGY